MDNTRVKVAQYVKELEEGLSERLPVSMVMPEAEREVLVKKLVSLGPDAIEPLENSIHFAESKVRIEIFKALGKIGTWPALLALMRFAYDEKDSLETKEERVFALRNIVTLAEPMYKEPLSAFINDMISDQERWVVASCLEMIGMIQNIEQKDILENYANSDDPLLKEKAMEATSYLKNYHNEHGMENSDKNKEGNHSPNEDIKVEAVSLNQKSQLPRKLNADQRIWVNQYRFASPTERDKMRKNLSNTERKESISLIQALSLIDEKGTSLALQWLISEAPEVRQSEHWKPYRDFVESVLETEPDEDTYVLGIRALTGLNHFKEQPLSKTIVNNALKRLPCDVTNRNRILNEALFALIEASRDTRFYEHMVDVRVFTDQLILNYFSAFSILVYQRSLTQNDDIATHWSDLLKNSGKILDGIIKYINDEVIGSRRNLYFRPRVLSKDEYESVQKIITRSLNSVPEDVFIFASSEQIKDYLSLIRSTSLYVPLDKDVEHQLFSVKKLCEATSAEVDDL